LKPRTFTDVPNVTIKHSDILLAFKDEIDRVYPTGKAKMVPQNLQIPDGAPLKKPFEHSLPREFYYFFKVGKDVTFRAFVVPEILAHVIMDWNVDKVPNSTEEGSISMCGKRLSERPTKYPDA
ncbi:25097_t:CDS:2, partial [Gigaspora rosea]